MVGVTKKQRFPFPLLFPETTREGAINLQYALEQMGSHLEACFWKCWSNSHLLEFPFSWHFACFPLWDSGFYFFHEIVPHFVHLLNPFLSVFSCKRAKSCFSKSFCRLARRWPRFPFARIPIFNALCLFFVLVPYSHLLEFPFARKCTVFDTIAGLVSLHDCLDWRKERWCFLVVTASPSKGT